MEKINVLGTVSKITDNIYLSGIYPLDRDPSILSKLDIKYVLCCVSKDYVMDIHTKVTLNNPDIVILYLPYDDDLNQNLWKKNEKLISIHSFIKDGANYDQLNETIGLYENKPLIEIGYHFMNEAIIQNKKILVHCMAGISRSVSLVVYYMMKHNTTTYNIAYTHVKKHRIIASPNNSFKKQLKTYEKKRELFTENDAYNIIISS